ncbi:hypothetical protein [Erythrobacter sp. EC-HK427]|uniref:hypothetical protein n=1 Tax=Erythrobacter sp. EC-HK427 TaxID=2038396 RepID=UPI00125C654A|nr:hypothetical protein [Erythrobacter sp. EC-HK427]VVT06326.1 hypothetical protein ERY430_41342 [Erythrobacter sp. EC-HK427]
MLTADMIAMFALLVSILSAMGSFYYSQKAIVIAEDAKRMESESWIFNTLMELRKFTEMHSQSKFDLASKYMEQKTSGAGAEYLQSMINEGSALDVAYYERVRGFRSVLGNDVSAKIDQIEKLSSSIASSDQIKSQFYECLEDLHRVVRSEIEPKIAEILKRNKERAFR